MSRRDELFERLVDQARNLYSLPAVAVEVLSLADNPQTDAAQLKRVVERDPALTAKLLRVVNSSLFGLTRKVSDLAQAVALLGAKPLKLLVLGFSLPDRLFAAKASDVLRRFWTRTLTRAVAARELAAAVAAKHGDELFIAGLLGDLGILVLVQECDDRYLRLYRRSLETGLELREAERRTFGFDHVGLTEQLLTQWNLPPSLVEIGVRALGDQSPQPTSADAWPGHESAAQIVRAADRLARLVVEERTELWPQLLDDAQEWWRLDAQRLSELSEVVQDKIGELSDVLNIELAEKHSFRATLERAHALLKTSSEDAVEELLTRRATADDEQCESAATTENAASGPHIKASAASDATEYRTAHQALRLPDHAARIRRGANLPKPVVEQSTFSAEELAPLDLTTSLAIDAAACRQARAPLSLVLVEIDRFDEGRKLHGPLWAQYIDGLLCRACESLDWPGLKIVPQTETRRALIAPHADRAGARKLVDDVTRHFRELSPLDEVGSTTLSFGTATVGLPPRNFMPGDLLAAADRCLFAAHAAAGDTSKGIEI